MLEIGDEVKTCHAGAVICENKVGHAVPRIWFAIRGSQNRLQVADQSRFAGRIDAMHPTEPQSLSQYFQEGLDARDLGKTLHDNPYGAGSRERHEWAAGFCATVDAEDDDKLQLDPNDNAERRSD
jgi:hypothetical protein